MRIFMVIIVLTILALGFMNECEAQYLPEVSSYNIYWNKLSEGEPILTDTFYSDTSIVILWEDSGETGIGYLSPYPSTVIIAMVVVNTPAIWTDNIAATSRDIILENGIYEVTCMAHDIYNNSSGHSEPMFVQVAKNVARIQVNLRIR